MGDISWTPVWTALQGISGALTFVVACVTLPFIASQAFIARRSHVEAVHDATTRDYLQFKRELYVLDVKQQRRDPFSWEDFSSLRMAAIRAELFFPTIRQMTKIGSDERSSQFTLMYSQDVDLVLELIEYALSRISDTDKKHGESMLDYFVDALTEWGATENEISAYISFEKAASPKADEMYAMVRSRHFTAQGMSADEIIAMDEAQDASTGDDAVTILRHYDLDYDGLALVAYWQKELAEHRSSIVDLTRAFVTKVGLQ